MHSIDRRQALAALAATFASSRAVATPSSFTTNMFGGRWENTWRERVLPPFSQRIGRPVTLDIGLGTSWVANFRAAGKDKPPFSAIMLNERYTAMLRDEGISRSSRRRWSRILPTSFQRPGSRATRPSPACSLR